MYSVRSEKTLCLPSKSIQPVQSPQRLKVKFEKVYELQDEESEEEESEFVEFKCEEGVRQRVKTDRRVSPTKQYF